MEIIFNCPHCDQELSVDAEGAGSQIPCPTCNEVITIPGEGRPAPAGGPAPAALPSPIAASAAAKIQRHLKVPMHAAPPESLIKKPAVPLEAVAKGADKQICVKTMRHDKCVESGKDKFDDMVTQALREIGEANLVAIHPISYEHSDVQTQKIMSDYGLLIIYRG
ncbi:MAG: hypothetical protein KGJ88_09460 [Verrucomicrobiota bacterium]|nr:hypothetical protein [Verrucomicrobiota bacterium]